MSVPARIAAFILTLALFGCSTQVVPVSSAGSTSAPGGSRGSGASGSGGSGESVPDCGSGGATSAAAYVYVSTGNSGNYQVLGFSAATDGALAPVPGSPFTTTGSFPLATAGTGSTLFGADGYNIDSYRVNVDGCLSLESSAVAGSPGNPGIVVAALYLDNTGATLYSFASDEATDGADPEFTSWNLDPGTGRLTQVGAQAGSAGHGLAFASNDQYALSPQCSAWLGPAIREYQRGGNGALILLGAVPVPSAAPGYGYCPIAAAADGSDHIVIGMGAEQGGPPSNDSANPDQFAIYTVDNSGRVSTSSTYQNMATSHLGWLDSLKFSPDSRYLAATGFDGLEVFAWDSTSMALTPIATIPSGGSCSSTGCSGSGFGKIAWDENDHLYTLLGQQLLVYQVSSSGVVPASGSPYTLQSDQTPKWVSVLPENQR